MMTLIVVSGSRHTDWVFVEDGKIVEKARTEGLNSYFQTRKEISLVPEPPEEFRSYTPHTPLYPVNARVVSIYGPGVNYAGSLQVVAINKGLQDGVEKGQVLALYTVGKNIILLSPLKS